ncbi:hypothetical protein, partial [Synechococcus sp. Ace-Pa]
GFWQRRDPFPPTKPNARSNAKLACDRLSISPVFRGSTCIVRECLGFVFQESRCISSLDRFNCSILPFELFGFQFFGGFPGLIERHKQWRFLLGCRRRGVARRRSSTGHQCAA